MLRYMEWGDGVHFHRKYSVWLEIRLNYRPKGRIVVVDGSTIDKKYLAL